MERKFGILMPIFSLDSKYGIGTFGKSAYKFVDFLSSCGVAFWQVLPLCPIDSGASPYSSPCGNAINPYFIDLELLAKKGLLTLAECNSVDFGYGDVVDYGKLADNRIELLRRAFDRYGKTASGYKDYALFMALKEHNGGAPWCDWGECAEYDSEAVAKFRDEHGAEISFWQFVQAEANEQWSDLRTYANGKGVRIIGDLPFYVAYDSVEVWTDKQLFALNGFAPDLVAGVPPDYFSKHGQLWGNPVYDWQAGGVSKWWSERIAASLEMFDVLRLDHFRAFDEYYTVKYGKEDATEGEWRAGPGIEFFLDKKHLPVIAEDLGIITPSVRKLLARTGYPGMRVLQFGFDGNGANPHLPSNVSSNCICYTGTHDNMTLKQFIRSLSKEQKARFVEILSKEAAEEVDGNINQLIDAVIELGCATDARLFVVPMVDLLRKDGAYRINTPSTVSESNWSVRLKHTAIRRTRERIEWLIDKYNRR